MTDFEFTEDWPEDHRSGVVAVVGRPNVGKSTLINAILGQKIAIVTPKPQTTRKRQLGIFTVEHGQILFVDTPGIHDPHHKLGEYMVSVAEDSLKDADIVLWILDISEYPRKSDQYIAQLLESLNLAGTVVLALNKVDAVEDASAKIEAAKQLVQHKQSFTLSALNNDGVSDLVEYLLQELPLGPRYYPADQVSEVNMRFIASEVIREKVILNTEKEIPHSVAVSIESYKEHEDRTVITAIIYVERDSQKGIVIGKGGQMIKTIGTEARLELVDMLEVPVHLDLRVKVLKNWRSQDHLMKRMGYRILKDED